MMVPNNLFPAAEGLSGAAHLLSDNYSAPCCCRFCCLASGPLSLTARRRKSSGGMTSDSDQALCFALKEAELPNVVPESLAEQTLDFSIDLVDPGYRELLDDPDSPQYIDLAHHLQDQVRPPPPRCLSLNV